MSFQFQQSLQSKNGVANSPDRFSARQASQNGFFAPDDYLHVVKLNAYLSGGMEFAENYGADWRSDMSEWLRSELNHDSFNPVRASEDFLGSNYPGVDFRAAKLGDFTKHQEIARKIVALDCHEIILKTDYVICYYDESAQRGAGTKGELTVAALFGKPVYFVIGMQLEKIPSWVLGCADETFRDFDTLKKFLLKKFPN
jgi:hypothetical protein